MEEPKKSNGKNIIAILLLIFIMPVGLVYMLIGKVFSRKVRIIVSCICVPIIIVQVLIIVGSFAQPSTQSFKEQAEIDIEQRNSESTSDKEEVSTKVEDKEKKSTLDYKTYEAHGQYLSRLEENVKRIHKYYENAEDILNDGDGVDIQALKGNYELFTETSNLIYEDLNYLEENCSSEEYEYYSKFIDDSRTIVMNADAILDAEIRDYETGLTEDEEKLFSDALDAYSSTSKTYDTVIKDMINQLTKDGVIPSGKAN